VMELRLRTAPDPAPTTGRRGIHEDTSAQTARRFTLHEVVGH